MKINLLENRDVINTGYGLKTQQILSEIGDNLNDITQDSFYLVLSKEKQLRKLFGGKGYNILLLRELAKDGGFKVPHTEFITTDFHRKLFKISTSEEKLSQIKIFDRLLDSFNNQSVEDKKIKIKNFLKDNPKITKTILNNISIDKLKNKYKILLEIFCDINGFDFETIIFNKDSIIFYSIIDGNKYESFSVLYQSFFDEFNISILSELNFIREKTYYEFIVESKNGRLTRAKNDLEVEAGEIDRIDKYWEDVAYGYNLREDLIEQANIFLDEKIEFGNLEEQYLKEIFDKFSNSKYLAIRSSANVEDGGDNNYPGIFYTGFCRADDFKTFKSEIMKVLRSYKGEKVKSYQKQMGLSEKVLMGIVIMDIPGEFYNDIGFDKPIIDFIVGPVYLQERKEKGVNEVLYYPDGGGVITFDDLLDDTFIRVKGVKGMPTSVTGNINQAIVVDIKKGTGEILGYENQPGNASYYKQTGVAGINKGGKIRYHLDVIYDKEVLSQSDIKNNMCYNELKEASEYSGCNFLPFSLKQYEKIASIYKYLENKLKKSLEIEFVIHNSKIYIVQSRGVGNSFKKLNNIIKPDKEFIQATYLGEKDIKSSMGYINNEELKVCYLFSSTVADVYEKAKKLERKGDGYFFILDGFVGGLCISKGKFPNLKCVVVKGYKGLGTHALMALREAGIPVILVNNNVKLSGIYGKYKVYINGSNGAMIYK